MTVKITKMTKGFSRIEEPFIRLDLAFSDPEWGGEFQTVKGAMLYSNYVFKPPYQKWKTFEWSDTFCRNISKQIRDQKIKEVEEFLPDDILKL